MLIKVEFIGAAALCGCPYLKTISVDRNNSRYVVKDEILYDKKEKAVVAYMQGYDGKSSKKEPIVILDGIQKINDYAFYWMDYDPYDTNKRETIYVSIPKSVSSIGAYAFANRAVNVSSKNGNGWRGEKIDLNLDLIGKYAFFNSVASMNLMVQKMEEHAFEEFYGAECFSCECENIPNYAFYKAKFSSSNTDDYRDCVFIGIKSIGDYAFSEANSINGIDFSSCIYIGNNAFEECRCGYISWRGIRPKFLIHAEHIGDRAFYACDWVVEDFFELSEGVVSIGRQAFCGSYSDQYVEKMYIPETVTIIDELAFERSKTTVIVEPDSYAEYWAGAEVTVPSISCMPQSFRLL